jgi:hypothetical protein
MKDKTPNGMDPEVYKSELEFVLKKKYNDETMAEIKKRARGLLYRIDFDLYVVLNWIIDTIEDSIQSSAPTARDKE